MYFSKLSVVKKSDGSDDVIMMSIGRRGAELQLVSIYRLSEINKNNRLRHFFNKRVSIGVNAHYKYVPVKTNGFSINAPYSYYDGPSFEGGELRQGALHVDIPERTWNPGGRGFGVIMGLHF